MQVHHQNTTGIPPNSCNVLYDVQEAADAPKPANLEAEQVTFSFPSSTAAPAAAATTAAEPFSLLGAQQEAINGRAGEPFTGIEESLCGCLWLVVARGRVVWCDEPRPCRRPAARRMSICPSMPLPSPTCPP